jgi:hypothetical protein
MFAQPMPRKGTDWLAQRETLRAQFAAWLAGEWQIDPISGHQY